MIEKMDDDQSALGVRLTRARELFLACRASPVDRDEEHALFRVLQECAAAIVEVWGDELQYRKNGRRYASTKRVQAKLAELGCADDFAIALYACVVQHIGECNKPGASQTSGGNHAPA